MFACHNLTLTITIRANWKVDICCIFCRARGGKSPHGVFLTRSLTPSSDSPGNLVSQRRTFELFLLMVHAGTWAKKVGNSLTHTILKTRTLTHPLIGFVGFQQDQRKNSWICKLRTNVNVDKWWKIDYINIIPPLTWSSNRRKCASFKQWWKIVDKKNLIFNAKKKNVCQ